ncbi:medium chain dehydrogenase/reductase family protein [Pendulispora brunnea]|uniref:Medium chain dehydrogenase/reductase family protein n=1 Tax=Pendulispora brunnea TaxID=2905690 RepID=A0ABZ2KHU8_9BACT
MIYRALVRTGTRVVVATREAPAVGDGELLIAPENAGLCGTDIQILRGLRAERASVIGHEGVGRVLARGARADARFAPGARVLVNPTHPTNAGFLLGHNVDGLLQEMVLIPESAVSDGLVLLAPHAPATELATLIEPLAAAHYALSILQEFKPRTLLAIGDGTIGHLAVRCAHRAGLRTILVHHTEAGLRFSGAHALGIDVSCIGPFDPRIAFADGPTAVLIATPRDQTLSRLDEVLRTAIGDVVIDVVGGLPAGAASRYLPGLDLTALRASNCAGRPLRPNIETRALRRSGRVHVTGHRGVSNDHLRWAAEELVAHPDHYRNLVTHVVDLHDAARIMTHLAQCQERVVDGRRLIKLAVRFPSSHIEEAS